MRRQHTAAIPANPHVYCRAQSSAHMSAALSSVPSPGTTPKTAKSELRERLKADLKCPDSVWLAAQSSAICAHLQQLPELRAAKSAVAFMRCERLREVDVSPVIAALLERNVALYLPKVQDRSSNMSMLRVDSLAGLEKVPPFGILEPTKLQADGAPREDLVASGVVPDVVLLPGLGFDRQGGRLGRGGGYYDKFLTEVARLADQQKLSRAKLLALAFREQLVAEVPMDAHDFHYDLLVTIDGVHQPGYT